MSLRHLRPHTTVAPRRPAWQRILESAPRRAARIPSTRSALGAAPPLALVAVEEEVEEEEPESVEMLWSRQQLQPRPLSPQMAPRTLPPPPPPSRFQPPQLCNPTTWRFDGARMKASVLSSCRQCHGLKQAPPSVRDAPLKELTKKFAGDSWCYMQILQFYPAQT